MEEWLQGSSSSFMVKHGLPLILNTNKACAGAEAKALKPILKISIKRLLNSAWQVFQRCFSAMTELPSSQPWVARRNGQKFHSPLQVTDFPDSLEDWGPYCVTLATHTHTHTHTHSKVSEGVVDKIMAFQIYPCVKPQNQWICDLAWQKGLCRDDQVKDLEIGTLFWIIWVGPM